MNNCLIKLEEWLWYDADDNEHVSFDPDFISKEVQNLIDSEVKTTVTLTKVKVNKNDKQGWPIRIYLRGEYNDLLRWAEAYIGDAFDSIEWC